MLQIFKIQTVAFTWINQAKSQGFVKLVFISKIFAYLDDGGGYLLDILDEPVRHPGQGV
jgi:hypothetical protein